MAVTVRLWERVTDAADAGVSVLVLERSDAALARPRKLGGRVFDVTVEGKPGPAGLRAAAETLLAVSRRKVDAESNDAGRVARARRCVVEVSLAQAQAKLPEPPPGVTLLPNGVRVEGDDGVTTIYGPAAIVAALEVIARGGSAADVARAAYAAANGQEG